MGKQLNRQQSEHAITNAQARAVKLGTTRRAVERRFGKPADTQESSNAGLGEDTCIYYNVTGGSFGRTWRFCFGGKDKRGTLRSKNRL